MTPSRRHIIRSGLVWGLALALAGPARATVLGGGVADKDCRVVFEGVVATAGASGVVCVDGDPACDADASADGACSFAPAACIGVESGDCAPVAIDQIAVGGVALEPPALPAGDGTCGPAASLAVATGAAAGVTLRAYLGAELRDVDYLGLCCVSAAGPFDAAVCALAIDPGVSGCAALPVRVVRKLGRARERVAAAGADPAVAATMLRKARKLVRRVRAIGQRIARRDDCGFALGLAMTHAEATLDDAIRSADESLPAP